MRKKAAILGGYLAAVIGGAGCIGQASAASSVSLYGSLDEGVTFASNQGGARSWSTAAGIIEPTRWGITGTEDLGDGMAAVFRLESQFSLDNGSNVGGNLFGRQAYVGLRNKYGTLTLGHQYDFMFDTLQMNGYDAASRFGGLYSLRRGPFPGLAIPGAVGGSSDFDRLAGERIDNAVKYVSSNMSGLTLGALYAFGGKAGDFSNSNATSFGVNFERGRFGVAAAYTNVRYPQLNDGSDAIRNIGLGTKYDFGKTQVSLLYTYTKNTQNGAKVDVLELAARHTIGVRYLIGASVDWMKGNAVLNSNKAYQFTGTVDYLLSKRTDVYALASYQLARAGGPGQALASLNGIALASSGPSQAVFRIGVRHRF